MNGNKAKPAANGRKFSRILKTAIKVNKDLSRLELNQFSKKIIGSAFEVGKHLKYGYLEKVYENALVYEIRKTGMKVEPQKSIRVKYKDIVAGEYVADMLVENAILVELKTTRGLDDSHIAQCLNYLTATDLRLGLLINFGERKIEFKRFVHHF